MCVYIYVYVRVLVSDFWLPTLCVFAESLLCFVWRCCLHVPLCLRVSAKLPRSVYMHVSVFDSLCACVLPDTCGPQSYFTFYPTCA